MDDNIALSTDSFHKQKSLLPNAVINRVTFHGNARDYFFIWLKNLFLCLFTLGMYLPWAIVNRRRYFLNATEINHARFEYRAKPADIFFSYLMAGLFFIFIIISSRVSVTLFTSLACIALLLTPYFLIKIWCFNIRNTHFNGQGFDYKCDYMKLYWVMLILPILLLIVVVIVNSLFSTLYVSSVPAVNGENIFSMLLVLSLIPIFGIVLIGAVQAKQFAELLINYLSYGKTEFSVKLQYKQVIIISLVGVLIFSPFIIAGLAQFSSIMQLMMIPEDIRPENVRLLVLTKIALFYLFILCGAVISSTYIRMGYSKYIMNSMTLGNLRFQAGFTFLSYFFLVLTNFLVTIFTLGFGAPYAHIRHARYLAENICIIGDIDNISGNEESETQADGDSAIVR